jgi:2-succinyl-6-hydroxy-2,4-cyclohexadiene-1-carboxylate synthase
VSVAVMIWGVRPTVLLLHGFTQTGASWRGVIEALGERYTALAPDLRGHGSAAARRPVTIDACVADLVAAAPERFALAGYSMGGRLALRVALAHPGRVERLVLVGTTPGIADDVERAARREADDALAAELEAGLDIEGFASRWGRQPIFKGQPPDVAAAAHEDRLRNDPAGLAAALRGLGQGAAEPLWARLGDLRMPVTSVAGERDGTYAKLAERMVARMPRARALIVPGAGHAVQLEAPGIVAAALSGGEDA